MSVKKRKSFAFGVGALGSLILCCGIFLFRKPSLPLGFAQTDCERPCWYNLQVGVSTERDVNRVLDTLVDKPEFIEYRELLNSELSIVARVHFQGAEKSGLHRIGFSINKLNDTLSSIYLQKPMSMGQALVAFGKPEGVIAFSAFNGRHATQYVRFYYPDKGIKIACNEVNILVAGLPCQKDTIVDAVYFFSPDTYEDRLIEEYGSLDIALKYMQPYNGLLLGYSDSFVATPIP